MLLELFWAVFLVGVLALSSHSLGRLLRGSRWAYQHPALSIAGDSALGLLLVSHIVLAGVLLQVVSEIGLRILWASLLPFAAVEALRVGGLWRTLKGLGENRLFRWSVVFLLAYYGWIALLSVLPATSIDEIVYHLEVPRRLYQAGGQVVFQNNIYAYFPQLGEMLFMMGGEAFARMVHALFGLLTALAVYGFSRSRLSRAYSAMASLIWLSVPTIMVVSAWAYVDLAFVLYALLSLYAIWRFIESGWSWVLPAGLMAGGAWSTKYTGLQWMLLLLLLLLVARLRSDRSDIPWEAAAVAALGVLVVCPYLARNWFLTGWPLFPFNIGFFELAPTLNWDPARSDLFLQWLSRFGSGDTRAGKLLSPILVFLTARFNEPRAYDGIVGPVFLLTPFLLRALWERALVRALAFCSLLFLFYWAITTQQVRFLLPVLPLLSFLLAWGLEQRKSPWWTGTALVLIVLNLGLGVSQVGRQEPWDYWRGREDAEEYQARRVPSSSLYREANRQVGAEDLLYLVNMSNFGYLLDCPWQADFVFEYYRLGQALEKADDLRDLVRFFREEGATHLMIDEDVTLSRQALGDREILLLRKFLEERTELIARNARRPGQTLRRISRGEIR